MSHSQADYEAPTANKKKKDTNKQINTESRNWYKQINAESRNRYPANKLLQKSLSNTEMDTNRRNMKNISIKM